MQHGSKPCGNVTVLHAEVDECVHDDNHVKTRIQAIGHRQLSTFSFSRHWFTVNILVVTWQHTWSEERW
eukprot:2237496-Amphidinium_carterae.1